MVTIYQEKAVLKYRTMATKELDLAHFAISPATA